jgi:hypothetical protein
LANKGKPNRLLLLYDPAIVTPDFKWVSTNVQMDAPGTITVGQSSSSATTWNAIIGKICSDPTDPNNYPDMLSADQWIIDKYRDGLVAGVMGRLMLLPTKPYSNQQLAAWYRQTYIAERSKARGDVIKANVWGGQRWMFPQSWATPHRGGFA